MVVRKICKMLFDKRAMSNVVSVTVLTGAVVALSLVVFGWAQSRSTEYNNEFGETVDAETARLKEKLAFEYIFYNSTSNKIAVYLLNCGTIDGVKIQTVHLYDSGNDLIESFSSPPLYPFQGQDEIPDQDLDKGEEGRLVLAISEVDWLSGFCSIRVVTSRGATFDSEFVA